MAEIATTGGTTVSGANSHTKNTSVTLTSEEAQKNWVEMEKEAMKVEAKHYENMHALALDNNNTQLWNHFWGVFSSSLKDMWQAIVAMDISGDRRDEQMEWANVARHIADKKAEVEPLLAEKMAEVAQRRAESDERIAAIQGFTQRDIAEIQEKGKTDRKTLTNADPLFDPRGSYFYGQHGGLNE